MKKTYYCKYSEFDSYYTSKKFPKGYSKLFVGKTKRKLEARKDEWNEACKEYGIRPVSYTYKEWRA